MSTRAPRQWSLTKNETISSFENWCQNLQYILSLDNNFAPFLRDNFTWEKKSAGSPLRGFADDGNDVAQDTRKTAAQKNAQLELMLGQIANYCPVISRNSIVKGSTSLQDIWQKIRQHFGLQSTGAHFLDLTSIRLETDERPEDLFQRLMAFFEDNLLTSSSSITHHGARVATDEDLTPTLENTVVALWLSRIHPGLPQLVKMKYGAELRNQTLASLKPDISQGLSALLDELNSMEEAKVCRSFAQNSLKSRPKSCTLCRTAGRRGANTHNLIDCTYLPESDRHPYALSSRCRIEQDEFDSDVGEHVSDQPSIRRMSVISLPYINTLYNNHVVCITLSSGYKFDMMSSAFSHLIQVPIQPVTIALADQSECMTHMDVEGEVHCEVICGSHYFQLDALVVTNLDVDVIGGYPFHVMNDITTRPAKNHIVVNGSEVIRCGNYVEPTPSVSQTTNVPLQLLTEQVMSDPVDNPDKSVFHFPVIDHSSTSAFIDTDSDDIVLKVTTPKTCPSYLLSAKPPVAQYSFKRSPPLSERPISPCTIPLVRANLEVPCCYQYSISHSEFAYMAQTTCNYSHFVMLADKLEHTTAQSDSLSSPDSYPLIVESPRPPAAPD